MPYRDLAQAILEEWREAERRRASVPPDSVEAEQAIADMARLRDEYQRVVAAAQRAQRPEPPAFPTVDGPTPAVDRTVGEDEPGD